MHWNGASSLGHGLDEPLVKKYFVLFKILLLEPSYMF